MNKCDLLKKLFSMKKSHGLRHFAIFSRSRRNASKSFICCFEFTQSGVFMPKYINSQKSTENAKKLQKVQTIENRMSCINEKY